jgi:hypothetical protein
MQTRVCVCEYRRVADDERPSITITLSPAQVDAVVRAASRACAPSLSTLIANSLGAPQRSGADSRGRGPDGAVLVSTPRLPGL